MDISALLSPDDSAASDTGSQGTSRSPPARPGMPKKRPSSGLAYQLHSDETPSPSIKSSDSPLGRREPSDRPQFVTPTIPASAAVNGAAHQALISETRSRLSNSPGIPKSVSQPIPLIHRTAPASNTSSAIAQLAEVAAAQPRSRPGSALPVELQNPQAGMRAPASPINLQHPTHTPPRSSGVPRPHKSFTAASLTGTESQSLAESEAHLERNPSDYNEHRKFIALLREGFVRHTLPDGNTEASQRPETYELVDDLRQARRNMDGRFAVGEDLFVEWIQDESLLARTTEDRVAVMELCVKAVQDEPASVRLWELYGEYMLSLWRAASDDATAEAAGWSKEDKTVGQEVFTQEAAMDVWERAVAATQHRLNDSHIVWDKYIAILLNDLTTAPTADKIRSTLDLFLDRLGNQPHATWDATFEIFSNFVTTYDNANYEDSMASTARRARKVKERYFHREPFELKLKRAHESGDVNAQWNAFTEYLDWEVRSKGVFSFTMINSLYERATINFPANATIWEDYYDFLFQHNENSATAESVSDVLARATRHCPWSGALWSHRLLALEAEGKSFDELEKLKHTATCTGLLEASDMEQLLRVYLSWCGFLSRRAFASGDEEDMAVALVGIKSTLEDVREIGEKMYGKEYKGDPQYRLERVYIKYLTQVGNFDAARDAWKRLYVTQENTYEFWYRYYIWEMIMWGVASERQRDQLTLDIGVPEKASAVLRQAMKRVETLDQPESLIQMFLNHCEHHDTIHELRKATVEARQAFKVVAARRQKEAEHLAYIQSQALVQAQASAPQPQEAASSDEMDLDTSEAANAISQDSMGKRKRDDDAADLDQQSKRSKPGPDQGATQLQRDRENCTLIVKDLPPTVSETDVRRLFKDLGAINRITLASGDDGTDTAAVEFESRRDAVYAAETRNGKKVKGQAVTVSLEKNSTLWVSNYPATADESFIRELFKSSGEITEVRFPSLKFDSHRRFCYVQFASADDAQSATEMNGKSVGDGLKLIAKISDPSLRKDRSGPAYEGREVFVGNVDFNAADDELRQMFDKVGPIEQIRVPRNLAGKTTGIAFVVFPTTDLANAAIIAVDGASLKSRKVKVKLSEPKSGGRKIFSSTIINRSSTSPSPSNPEASVNGDRSSTLSKETSGKSSIADRTIALVDLPDTVNDARIRALLEPHGSLRKIVLRPDHAGAIVEFEHVADVGKASLAVDGYEIVPGRPLRVSTPQELLKMKGERKLDRIDRAAASAKSKSWMSQSPHVSRPGQTGTAGRGAGRRGGLGLKNAGVGLSGPRAKAPDGDATSSGAADAGSAATESAGPGKTNADFKNMFLKGERRE